LTVDGRSYGTLIGSHLRGPFDAPQASGDERIVKAGAFEVAFGATSYFLVSPFERFCKIWATETNTEGEPDNSQHQPFVESR